MIQNARASYILTCKRASRYSSVPFLHSGTSKSGPNLHVFNILTWKCVSRHSGVPFLDSDTSKTGPKVLRAPSGCNCWTSELEKVVRDRQFFSILTWKCASRHSGVQFFISLLKTWLRTRRFSEPTFRPSRNNKLLEKQSEKNRAIRDFPNISRVCSFFLLTFAHRLVFFFWLYVFSVLFIFWLCFSALPFNCPYCRKFHF